MPLRFIVCCLFIAVVAACTTPPTKPKRAPNVNLSGFPPEYKAGYLDGCNSASTKKEIKDVKRYPKDSNYTMGWRDGFDICKKN